MKYGILKIDPPWEKKKGGLRKVRPKQTRELDYPTMEIHSIFNLLDKEIFPLAKENHCVFLWCIDEYLSDIDNWMFERGYKRHARIIWDKENGVAPAFTVRFAHEYLIWYYKGKFMPIAKEWRGKVTTILREKSRQHSRKPNCAYWMIESFYPDENKLDVFAREKRFGWYVWGNETDKFNAPEFTLASPTFPTEKAINRNLQVTPSASPKEATLPSVYCGSEYNSDLVGAINITKKFLEGISFQDSAPINRAVGFSFCEPKAVIELKAKKSVKLEGVSPPMTEVKGIRNTDIL